MEYAIKTQSLFVQKLFSVLSYFRLIQIEWKKTTAYTKEAEIAQGVLQGYREMQELRRKGQKGRDAFDLLAELRKEEGE